MTRSALIIVMICASFVMHAQCPVPDDRDAPILNFQSTTFNFDTVHQGDYVTHLFSFTNTGKSPLIIQNVAWQTGISPIFFSKEPIAPGATSSIRINFLTSGKYGEINKVITISSNNKFGDVQLHLQGVILPLTQDPNAPVMVFDSTTYWFDTVYQGSIIDHEFRFTNTGKSPLLISNVCGSSGSVVPEWPKEPIAPGKSGMVRVVFHTGGKMGPQEKCVTITSNASEATIILRVKGYVTLPPKKDEFPPPAPQNRIGQ